MNLKKYEAFVKVVDLGSLTRAAQAIGYTQSGVSHMIQALEDDFGFLLLRRSRSGVQLTSEGESVLPAIRSLLNSSEQLRQTVSSLQGLEVGTVRIAAFSSVAVHWLPGMLRSFQALYPKIEFQLMTGDYHDVELWLSSGAADLGFLTLPSKTKPPLTCIPLLEDPLLAILPPDHPLAGASAYPLKSLPQDDFIGLLEQSAHDLRRILDPLGIAPNLRFTTKDDYAIIAMVANGLGVSIMPRLLLQASPHSPVCALPLEPPATRTIALALAGAAEKSPVVRHFSQHVQTWISENSTPL